MIKINPYTRYYSFTRVYPSASDYELLLDTCVRIDAYLGYWTFNEGNKIRLVGFIILRGKRTHIEDIQRLFPNFNITFVVDPVEVERFRLAERDGILVTPKGVMNSHPYESIRRELFVIDDDGGD